MNAVFEPKLIFKQPIIKLSHVLEGHMTSIYKWHVLEVHMTFI